MKKIKGLVFAIAIIVSGCFCFKFSKVDASEETPTTSSASYTGVEALDNQMTILSEQINTLYGFQFDFRECFDLYKSHFVLSFEVVDGAFSYDFYVLVLSDIRCFYVNDNNILCFKFEDNTFRMLCSSIGGSSFTSKISAFNTANLVNTCCKYMSSVSLVDYIKSSNTSVNGIYGFCAVDNVMYNDIELSRDVATSTYYNQFYLSEETTASLRLKSYFTSDVFDEGSCISLKGEGVSSYPNSNWAVPSSVTTSVKLTDILSSDVDFKYTGNNEIMLLNNAKYQKSGSIFKDGANNPKTSDADFDKALKDISKKIGVSTKVLSGSILILASFSLMFIVGKLFKKIW